MDVNAAKMIGAGLAPIREYRDAMAGKEAWRTVFSRYGIRLVLIENDAPLANVLRREPGWKEVYGDEQAVVFTKGEG